MKIEELSIYILNESWDQVNNLSNPVLIMAGGLGSRLHPLTQDRPKPMLQVGGKPLLEIIIGQLKNYGYTNILLSVNYHREYIEDYFRDGDLFGVHITYIRENRRLGTAGSVFLARQYLQEPFFVINGDILTKVNFQNIMSFHLQENTDLTVATTQHGIQIPYGVIETNGSKVECLREKPRLDFFINAGIYCMNPGVINYIPKDEYFDMTNLIDDLLIQKQSVSSFPIHEYWLDIGQIADYEKANEDYESKF
jgi:NDP-sugar pyrophosphorylase family protein